MAGALVIGQVRDPLQWEHWSEARAMLDPALSLSDEDWPSVEAELQADTMQLVGILEGGDLLAAAVIRTIRAKLGDMIEIFICGGRDFKRWSADLAKAVEEGAERTGCVGVRTWGRPGWKVILAPLGWKSDVVCFERLF